MALLAASRSPRGVSLSQRSDVISTIYPLVNSAVQFQQLLGSAALHFAIRTYFAATLLAAALWWASKNIVWRSLLVSRIIAARVLFLTRRLTWATWDSKQCRRLRKRLEFELFVLILGPSGNALLLMIFWPGWPMLAFLGWGVWRLTS